MKPRIRKKGKNQDGTTRYVIEWIEEGKFHTFAINPAKYLDYVKKSKISKEND